ncbi:hypothetical protein BGW36DRAFT_355963 [Talaromyces proteolyticus]|uniref:Uncharacterized protein n=1 Tax=Talaromyces proteolyticus TaxID=1131652 RepID=A0AAD4PYR8_9EURO|nr:uncharacterized protein BGW36DRAFT_355963 [Talaromyces proteolyticus]KAH8701810.1 hypothetical protein BGW36DRAFT_355963 [Talaromyces proteolyticus]
MAAPESVTIENLTGTWTLDSKLSADADPLLSLQGIGWIVRKGIKLATVTIKLKQFVGKNPQGDNEVLQLTIGQSTGTGLGSTTENRLFDGTETSHEDHIFGKTLTTSKLIGGSASSDGKIRPTIDIQTQIKDPEVAKFLRGEITDDLKLSEGYLVEGAQTEHGKAVGQEGVWAHVIVKNNEGKWLAEQVWGFETINNERRYVRRTVVSDKKNYKLGRFVYSYVGPESD